MITPQSLRELAQRCVEVSLSDWGDPVERKALPLLRQHFPAYEPFWRTFVYPYRDDTGWLNLQLPLSHEAACMYNYSVMRSVVRLDRLQAEARNHKHARDDTASTTFDEYFVRLGIAHSQIRQFGGGACQGSCRVR